jgi:hypothetical protein
MNNKKKSRKITPGELSGDVLLPHDLTPAEKKEADRQLAEARAKTKGEMTEETRIRLTLRHIKYRIEDYLESKEYDPKLTFGYFLKEYVILLDIKRKTFAEEISIDETLLSQLINMHRLPPDYLAIRLEIHSNNFIPASYWYKLVEREKEYHIRTDKAMRRRERKFVHNRIPVNV